MTTYSAVGDLLTGDLILPSTFVPENFVQMATDEIDSKLGFVYETPIVINAADFPRHEKLLISQIANKLASGRIILALDVGGEDRALHSYGLRLVTEATNDLMQIANGVVKLRGATEIEDEDDSYAEGGKLPRAVGQDEVSPTEAFYAATMQGQCHEHWRPGKRTDWRA